MVRISDADHSFLHETPIKMKVLSSANESTFVGC